MSGMSEKSAHGKQATTAGECILEIQLSGKLRDQVLALVREEIAKAAISKPDQPTSRPSTQ